MLAACLAADERARVCLLERSSLFGGSTAVSGGMAWVPNNPHLRDVDSTDSPADALTYLRRVAGHRADSTLLESFVAAAPEMVGYLEEATPVRFVALDRPDYHPEWEGARMGRTLEPLPCSTSELGPLAKRLRASSTRPPLTFTELREGDEAHNRALADDRNSRQIRTQGGALAAGLLRACADRGVVLCPDSHVLDLLSDKGRVTGVVAQMEGSERKIAARKGVVLASGGFEWNKALTDAFLPGFAGVNTTPPWNEGDGLLMGLRLGAAIANMTEAWWTAAVQLPGETYDDRPLARNIVSELARPGSIVVNRRGERFVNEATNYHDLGKAFLAFDPAAGEYINSEAWLVFDTAFQQRYSVASIPAKAKLPEWVITAGTLKDLAQMTGIDPAGLTATVTNFNHAADAGQDPDFHRGESLHDRFYGDSNHQPNPCLGSIRGPSFHAIPVRLGALGTKGGLCVDAAGRVLSPDGAPLPGLYACGNVTASAMGLGYPGAGGTLGPILAAAYLCGQSAARGD